MAQLDCNLSPVQKVYPVVPWLTHIWPVQVGTAVKWRLGHHLSETGEIMSQLISIYSYSSLLLKTVGL